MKIAKDGTLVILTMDQDEFASLLFLTGYATGSAMREHDTEGANDLQPFAKALYNAVKREWK